MRPSSKFEFFKPFENKSVEDLIKYFSFGMLLPILKFIFEDWKILWSDVVLLSKLDFGNLSTLEPLLVVLFVDIYISIIVLFYKLYSLGWFTLFVIYSVTLCVIAVNLILVLFFVLNVQFFYPYSIFHSFNVHALSELLENLIYSSVCVVFLSRNNVLIVFNVDRRLRIVSVIISLIIFVIWLVFMLPDTIQETEGPRRFLPIDYYNRFDVSVNRFDFWKIQDCDDQRVIDLFNDGARLRSQYEFASARYCFEQALRLEPSNIVLVEAMADCYAHENNLKKAIDCLDKAMLIDNSKFELYNNRGLYYYSTYDYQNAMNDYNRAFAIDSTNAILHENLSLLCYQMNKQNESFSEVEKAERFGSNKRRVKEIKTIIGYYNVGELKMKRKPEINKIIESIHKEK